MTVWTSGGLASRVCGKTEHPEYNKHSLHRDIAVLHLCTQITFTEGTVKLKLIRLGKSLDKKGPKKDLSWLD